MKRQIEAKLIHWKNKKIRKPLFLQGARQVGKTYVLQELYAYGLDKIVTWSGKTSEIEFVLEINGNILPVEVKAGSNTKAKSLLAFINKYRPVYSVKFTGNKFGCDMRKKIFNYPLYMISKFPELCRSRG